MVKMVDQKNFAAISVGIISVGIVSVGAIVNTTT